MQAYCMKCRAKQEMKDPKKITMKNGKPATKGVCPKCSTKMFRNYIERFSKINLINMERKGVGGSYFIKLNTPKEVLFEIS